MHDDDGHVHHLASFSHTSKFCVCVRVCVCVCVCVRERERERDIGLRRSIIVATLLTAFAPAPRKKRLGTSMQEGKLRVLCFHGFRTSAAFFEKQIRRWDSSILQLLDLTFLDGPYPASGKSDVEAIFPGPYFEWFQFNKDYSAFTNLEECKDFIAKYMQEHGPFDGLMGFSQGGVLAAAFAGLQQKGMALQGHPPLRFIILVSGTGFNNEQVMDECYSELVQCPSVHIIGDQDYLRKVNEELVQKFKDPLVIRHNGKHTVPRLGEEETKLLRDFLLQIQLSSPSAATEEVSSGDAGKNLFELSFKQAEEAECTKA